MSRRDTIWKWVFYTAGVLLLLLLQGLALDHISLLHVHPYLPPVMVAVLAMFEGAYGGMGVALAMGLLFDLTQPGLIPCFHILAFLLAALAAAAVANYLITPGLLCAVLMGVAALVITNGLQILLMTYQQGVAFSAASSLAGREILVTPVSYTHLRPGASGGGGAAAQGLPAGGRCGADPGLGCVAAGPSGGAGAAPPRQHPDEPAHAGGRTPGGRAGPYPCGAGP